MSKGHRKWRACRKCKINGYGICLVLEIFFNICNLIIIPKKNKYEKKNLYEKCCEIAGIFLGPVCDCRVDDLVEEFDSIKKTSIAIIVFGSFMCVLHFFKIIRTCVFQINKLEIKDKALLVINICLLIINFSLAISLNVKIKDIDYDKKLEDFFSYLKDRFYGVVALYASCFVLNFIQYLPFFCCNYGKDFRLEREIPNLNHISVYAPSINSNKDNISNSSRKIIEKRIEVNKEIKRMETNEALLLRDVLPRQIYENLNLFIDLGKQKLIALVKFYQEMQFVGFTSDEIIKNEITNIAKIVSILLSEGFEDPITKVLFKTKSDESIMLLIHYTFPLIIKVIKLKLEKGIYRRDNVEKVNIVKVLTQLEQNIIREEQGNKKLFFRFSRHVNRTFLDGLLNK